MQFIGHLIVRSVTILAGLLFAFFCCGIFVAVGLFYQVVDPRAAELGYSIDGPAAIILAFVTTPFLAAAALGPALALIAIAEIMRWRGLTANALLGGGAALLSYWLAVVPYGETDTLRQGTVIALLATGFVGGLAYWPIAGRSAGRWLDRPSVDS